MRCDQHAVQRIPRNIELIRYEQFGDDLELVNYADRAGGWRLGGGRNAA